MSREKIAKLARAKPMSSMSAPAHAIGARNKKACQCPSLTTGNILSIDSKKSPCCADGFKHSNVLDIVAERLRRWTANPLGSPRVGSNVDTDVKRKEPMLIETF